MKNMVKSYISDMKPTVIEHGYVKGERRNVCFEFGRFSTSFIWGGASYGIMEAYHAGCAVISTSVGAIPEVVTEKNGFIIELGIENSYYLQ